MANNTTPRSDGNTAKNDQGRTAEPKTKKGFWARYIDRLADTRCTLTPPECR